jgi:phosphoglycerol transferase MdoB-like AlkP superfamily enzyme
MKTYLKYAGGMLVFWMLVFALQRGIFLWYNYHADAGIQAGELALSFVYGLRMDLATAMFLIAVPLLLMTAALFSRKKIFALLANIVTVLLILLVVIIGLADTGLFSNWGSKFNSKALFYLMFPQEGLRATGAVPMGLMVLLLILQLALFVFVYLKWLRARAITEKVKLVAAIPICLLLLACLPVMFRGGFQKYPLGKNDVYYSQYPLANYAAMNSAWNLVYTLSKSGNTENPYRYFPQEEAHRLCRQVLDQRCDSTDYILNTQRPNIVLILMESVSAANMRRLGGAEEVMPGLDSLCSEGLLFTHFYASGFRTEQGLIAYLSSFPAQPVVTIQREFGKFELLPGLPLSLKKSGYTCNYYYSGDLNFANTSAYLHSLGFKKLLDRDARPWKRCTQWGAMDEELFRCHLDEAGSDAQPFFSVIMTSTNHEAFDAPVTQVFGGGEAGAYKNTTHYTDSCVYAYLRAAAKQSWYANTIFIITSDHAHFYPQNLSKSDPERHHIPFLLLGGALKAEYRGRQVDKYCSQVDLSSLLLNQLQLPDTAFHWSMNPLSPCYQGFAFYAFDNGFGCMNGRATVVYDHDAQRILLQQGDSTGQQDMLLQEGKAYLQELYREYLGEGKP